MSLPVRIAVDIGGTFTDFISFDHATGSISVLKRLTTPADPDRGVVEGVDALAKSGLAAVSAVIHATTLATNAVIERKGQPTALLTTAGFEDILEIGRGYRYDLYDLMIRKPKPLIPRPLRLGITERVGANGSVLTALVEDDVRKAAAILRAAGAQAIAVCYLHSYLNAAHELRTAEILAKEMPDVPVSLSHQVIAEPKEFERTSTTAVDAYIKPTIARYLDRLETALQARNYERSMFVMLSNGGTATAETARTFPVQMLESAAAGVEAASYFAGLLGLDSLLAFDMGGTTAKLCLVRNGKPSRTRSFEIHHVHRFKAGSGLPVSLPVYDLLEIGAGGGSIAHVNSLNLLQVGPESAGADPGPACYGAGGTQPTVTDADVVLGYLDPLAFLGGEMRLDEFAAAAAIGSNVAEPLQVSTLAAAWGIHDLVNENMAAAARIHIAERGQDAGRLALVAFGGAGPIHALGVARKLGCPQLIVPPRPGVLSAFGLLVASISFEKSQAVRSLLDRVELSKLNATAAALESEVRSRLPRDVSPNVMATLELLYLGQDHPVEIEAPALGASHALAEIKRRFENAYRDLYGSIDDMPIELINIRVKLSQKSELISDVWTPDGSVARIGTRDIYLSEDSGFCAAEIFRRSGLIVGQTIVGPAVILERESTTIIGRNDRLSVHEFGCLVIDLAATGHPQVVNEQRLQFA